MTAVRTALKPASEHRGLTTRRTVRPERCPTARCWCTTLTATTGWVPMAAMQIGPYATAELKRWPTCTTSAEGDIEPDESLPEAEQALGLSDWLDPDTGELAEATHTRIEDH